LKQEVDDYLTQAEIPDLQGEVIALIAPHAGHIYSGRTAGHAFRAVHRREYDLVVVVSPFHSFHSDPLLTSAHGGYSTPLGSIEIDKDTLDELDNFLAEKAGEGLTAICNDQEHSLEIELPFLQQALAGEFRLLPVMVHTHEPEAMRQLGRGLAHTLRERDALLVASTDLSHFYPEKVANEFDDAMLKQIAALSPEGVLETERTGKGFACGAPGVAAVLWAAKELGATKGEILHYSTSAEASGDRSSVVGYGAVVVLK
jgi:AmmeMemoRadiSam system protein B